MKRVGPVLLAVCCLGWGCTLGSTVAAAGDLQGDEAYSAGDYAGAFREWNGLAQSGDVSAMLAIGTLYDTGMGVQQDFAKALEWYRRAAAAGNVRAMFNAGAMYDSGRGVATDRAEALRWYEAAAAAGNGRAAYAAGVIYRDGDGVPRNRAAAIRNFRIAADAGLEAGRTNLAALGVTGSGLGRPAPPRPAAPVPSGVATPRPGAPVSADIAQVERQALARGSLDPALAATLSSLLPTLVDQAGKGAGMAQYDVAYAYEYGHGVAPDPVKSYVYYLRAAAAPDAELQNAARRGATAVGKGLTDAQHVVAREMLLDDAR